MVSRQELYDLVWSTPISKAAEQFQVSGSYLARVCTALNVPRPGRGYWAKLAAGGSPKQTPLPEAKPGDQLSWTPGGELSPSAKLRTAARDEHAPTFRSQSRAHWLITSARQHFDNSRPIKDGEYLKPYKKLLVDITSSKACLEKAFGFASALFNAFEAAGHRVVLGQRMHRMEQDEHEVRHKQQRQRYPSLWTPSEPTIVYIGTVPVGLALIEISENVLMRYVNGEYVRDADYRLAKTSRYRVDHTWTTTQSIPSRRLRLVAYSPFRRVSWSKEWQETPKSTLQNSLREIVRTIEGSAVVLSEKMAEAERIAEKDRLEHLAAMERYEREEDRRRIEQSLKDSREHLAQIIQKWINVKSVEDFLRGVEDHIGKLPDERKQAAFQRLGLAREFLGSTDPMDLFLAWKSPSERYQSPYRRDPPDAPTSG